MRSKQSALSCTWKIAHEHENRNILYLINSDVLTNAPNFDTVIATQLVNRKIKMAEGTSLAIELEENLNEDSEDTTTIVSVGKYDYNHKLTIICRHAFYLV